MSVAQLSGTNMLMFLNPGFLHLGLFRLSLHCQAIPFN